MREWEPTDFYCPFCGKHAVAQDDSEDYYVGSTLWCLFCNQAFHLA